ncbi:MAG: tRNA (guanosine(46)-N7)-methyltransferase TrmB [Aggregatilineales bacterium]
MTNQPIVNQTKLNNPHPNLNSHHMAWSTDWDALFGRSAPLILEIGFGLGHFLGYLHEKHPDKNIVGIEINSFCLGKVERAIVRDGWDNVRVVFSRAETALNHLFEPQSLTEIHINFPDPWFKERHSARRLMQPDTLSAMVSRLVPGGKLFLATDIIAYAEMSDELLSQTAGLTNLLDGAWVNEIQDRVVTKYERRAREEGRECYYFAYQRNDSPVPPLPIIKELEMPHIVLQTPVSFEAIVEQFRQSEHSDGDTHVKLMHAYLGDKAVLFEVFVHEPTIDQLIALLYIRKEGTDDQYTLKLSALGNPRPTAGAHLAVKALGEWLISLSDETQVIHNKVRG